MAVADVPDPIVSTIGGSVTGFDRLQALGAGVTLPTVSGLAGEGAAVASIPDQVSGFESHGVV